MLLSAACYVEYYRVDTVMIEHSYIMHCMIGYSVVSILTCAGVISHLSHTSASPHAMLISTHMVHTVASPYRYPKSRHVIIQ